MPATEDPKSVVSHHYLTNTDVRQLARKPHRIEWPDLCRAQTKRERKRIDGQLKKNQDNPAKHNFTMIKPIKDLCSGKELEKIIGTVVSGGRLMHLVKWKGYRRCNLVPSAILNELWPAKIIEYYQENLKFVAITKN